MSKVTIHNKEGFKKMRQAGKQAAEILDYITEFVVIGVTTNRLNELCHNKIIEKGAIPAPLHYRGLPHYKGFPKSVCTSINHVICHGIPSDKRLKDGDILNIDVTVIVDGWHGDTSRMYYVGKPSIKDKRLCQVTYDAMMIGIDQVKPGNTLGDIGYAIQAYVESNGFSVVRDYCGHGVGKIFHAEPSVFHHGKKGSGLVLEEGMFFTIEPMVNVGGFAAQLHHNGFGLDDGWTVTTKDKSHSAQFEHTMGVTRDGVEVFTDSPRGLNYPPYFLK